LLRFCRTQSVGVWKRGWCLICGLEAMLLMVAPLRGQALKLLTLHLSLALEGNTEGFEVRLGNVFSKRVGGKVARYTIKTASSYHQDASQFWQLVTNHTSGIRF